MESQSGLVNDVTQDITSNENSKALMQRRQVENKNRVLADYELIRIIGTGTFGRVYLAKVDGQFVALKVLPKKRIIELK